MSFDRYSQFREGNEIGLVPFGEIPRSSSDMYEIYRRGKTRLDKISYDYDSVRVERSKKENVYVKVDATVTNSQGDSQKVTITVVLIEEANGWRICNPTYANYNALNDRYNELENQKIKNNK